MLSVFLLAAYFLWEKKRKKNFLFLLGCVSAANVGYFLLAVAGSLAFAKAANVISYFGSVYAVLAMMFIIADVCRMERSRWLRYALIGISTSAFLLAASGDWLGLYYTEVSITTVNGMTRLVKDYGPLHILYTVYLLGYILGMVGIIQCAWKKQKLTSLKYTMLLMMAVLLNLGVWAVEQAVDIDFEFLSVSYIVTEIFLLLRPASGADNTGITVPLPPGESRGAFYHYRQNGAFVLCNIHLSSGYFCPFGPESILRIIYFL